MAVYTIAAGKVAVHDKTLAGSTVDAVNFAEDPGEIEILTDGAAALYFTIDGTTPTVSGASTYVLPAVACSRTIKHPGTQPVRLISSGTPKYSVMVV